MMSDRPTLFLNARKPMRLPQDREDVEIFGLSKIASSVGAGMIAGTIAGVLVGIAAWMFRAFL